MVRDFDGCRQRGSVWGLYLAFIDTGSGMVGRAQYSPDIFEAATIAQMLEDLRQLMESVVDDLGQRISTLPLRLDGVVSAAKLTYNYQDTQT